MQAFDPEANSWSVRASMPLPIGHNTAATFEWRGCLMVAGGTTNGPSQISSVLAYDPGTDTWVTVGMLPVPGQGVAAATEDEIIVASDADTWIGTVESDIEGWDPLVELRDDTATWPNEKPEGGWWVTPIHATLL